MIQQMASTLKPILTITCRLKTEKYYSFDANEFLMDTSQGWMVVHGKDLTLAKMDTDHGDVIIKGVIDSIEYITNKKGNGKDSLISRLFK